MWLGDRRDNDCPDAKTSESVFRTTSAYTYTSPRVVGLGRARRPFRSGISGRIAVDNALSRQVFLSADPRCDSGKCTVTLKMPAVRGQLTTAKDMAALSWLRVGGPAEWFFQPADLDDLVEFLAKLHSDTSVFPVGVCSNLIIRDGGLDGVVVKLGRGFNGIENLGDGRFAVGAGALDAHVARKAADAGVDLTFLRTIPGTIGGAIRMNAGCYGTYLADVFVQAEVVLRDGIAQTLKAGDLNFGYRSTDLMDGAVLTKAILQGPSGDPDALHETMSAQLKKRDETQPTKERSCGSTFRNPAGFSSTGQADDVQDLKAWKVIDQAGMRGAKLGGAQMSKMHPNFLINTGNATASDLEKLGEEVRERVFQSSGISLQWEIKRVGKQL
jgi:UDP-N-acetylmuramate dehydrogenase